MESKDYPISSYIVKQLILYHAISEEQSALYLYCANAVLEYAANLLSCLLTGILFFRLSWTILFLVCIIPLRSYAGGWHARTGLQCYLLSMAVYIITMLLCSRLIDWISLPYQMILFLISSAAVVLLSPVETPQKPLTPSKRKKFRICTLWIVMLILLQMILFSYFQQYPCLAVCGIILLYTWISQCMELVFKKHSIRKDRSGL